MEQAQSTNSTEQRRRLLKGALGASTVMGMGYSSAALASFQCITTTTPYAGVGFKTSINTTSNWAWLKLQVYDTNKTNIRAVKIPVDANPASINTATYQYDNSLTNPLLTPIQNGTNLRPPISNTFAYVIIYFKIDGSIAGFFPTYTPITGSDYPAQGSCLTSLNPNLVQTNIFYGG